MWDDSEPEKIIPIKGDDPCFDDFEMQEWRESFGAPVSGGVIIASVDIQKNNIYIEEVVYG